MIKNYFRTAWRNLVNNRVYSLLNIGGLAVGISVCMLIILYSAYIWSYDRFHAHASRIFYPGIRMKIIKDEGFFDRMSYVSGPILQNADPGIESFLRVETITQTKVIENPGRPDRKFTERKILMADSNFFHFFSFRLLEGNPQTALSSPFSMVVTPEAAQKYFGSDDPIGKTLLYEGKYLFRITGIAAEPPSNSSIDFDFIGSSASARLINESPEDSTAAYIGLGQYTTYVLLRDKDHAGALTRLMATLGENNQGKFSKLQFSLNALVDRHKDMDTAVSAKYRKIFPLVAGLILLLALINYMSLATARSAIRAKEIGVRKVFGADRGNIIRQFYIESGMYGCLAFLLALLLFTMLRPAFYNLLQIRIDENFFHSGLAYLIFVGLLVATVVISGSYPSLVLSSFSPIKVLYGRLGKQKVSAFIRQLFMVLQFTISVALIICSMVINRQIYFFPHMDTGMDRDQVLMIPYQKTMGRIILLCRRRLRTSPGLAAWLLPRRPFFWGWI